jgi:hypothetical protein
MLQEARRVKGWLYHRQIDVNTKTNILDRKGLSAEDSETTVETDLTDQPIHEAQHHR